MAFLGDNLLWTSEKIHEGEKVGEDEWECILSSEVHHYQPAILKTDQMARITAEDELVIELYEKTVHR